MRILRPAAAQRLVSDRSCLDVVVGALKENTRVLGAVEATQRALLLALTAQDRPPDPPHVPARLARRSRTRQIRRNALELPHPVTRGTIAPTTRRSVSKAISSPRVAA